MTQLEGCIRFWENKLKDRGLFEPSTIAQIEWTVRFLKRAKAVSGFLQDLPKEK